MKDKHKKKLGRKARLQKGREWLLSYDRSQKRIVMNYGKYFHVDIRIVAEDLQELGVSDAMIQHEEIIRIRKQKSMQKKTIDRKNIKDRQTCMRTVMTSLHILQDIRMMVLRMV